MKSKGSLKNEAFMSTIITILLVVLVCGVALIAYRVENTMNIEPFVLFTLTDHMDGTISYSLFNLKGTIDFRWVNGLAEKVNQYQVFIHPSLKAFTQLVSGIVDGAYQLVNKYLL